MTRSTACTTAQTVKHLQKAQTDPVAYDTALRYSASLLHAMIDFYAIDQSLLIS